MTNQRLLLRRMLILLVLCALFGALGAQAQDDPPTAPTRDARDLAGRYLGFDDQNTVPPLTPIYRVGDEVQFWVSKAGSATPVRVNATLAAAAPNVYLWLEDGVTASGSLPQVAQQLSQLVTAFRVRDNYRELTFVPGLGTINDASDLLFIPDVDNDPHLFILYGSDLTDVRNAIINPLDSQPVEVAPYSNQHEMLYVNTTPFAGTPFSDPLYMSILARGIYRWVMINNVPGQALWLNEALNWLLLFSLQQTQVDANTLAAFLQAPDTPLLQPATPASQTPTLALQQLFLAYVLQRYDSDVFNDLFLQTGSGTAALDAVLAQHGITDPVTGAPVTARDAFADFAMTNLLNLAFGDGRYYHNALALPQDQTAAATLLELPAELSGLSVNQFGTQYYAYQAAQAETLSVRFDGSATVARLSMPVDRDPADPYYWSGRAADANPTLTRTVDLTDVDTATLTFDAWYDLAPGWNYGYVSVSTDGGATWDALAATTSSPNNRGGAAYGAAFTGVSNPDEPHPFPIMGVVIGGDGVTASEVSAGSPAAQAGVLPGDVIIGYDSHEWTTAPNILGLLANYAPGDTLNLYIQRGTERLDIPVVLGAHPSRIVEPSPLWLAQSVDLTPYTGQEILLRFETVTLPGQEDNGFAVDHIAIPEIDYMDENTGQMVDGDMGWTMDGWQHVANALPQRWIVQVATGGTQTTFPRVQPLISPEDDASTAETRIALAQGETLLLAVSGANDDTTERATFSLTVTSEN